MTDTTTNAQERRNRERKAYAIWGALVAAGCDYEPGDEQCALAARVVGVPRPSLTTCNRVREIARQTAAVAS